jgi:tetratricopeptide (TPR) repeat protein
MLIVAAAIAAYANGLDGAFTYDDKAIIRDDLRIRSPRSVTQIFSTQYFGGPRGTGSNYRPVLLLSFAIQWWVHGRQVVAFHAVNLLLHVAATLMLARLFLRIGLPPPVVWASALLFALHPIHVEAVTSLVGRGETLSSVLLLGYLHAALSFFEGKRRALFLVAAFSLYALAFFAKESAVATPGAALLLFLFIAGGPPPARFQRALARGWPVLAASAVALAGALAVRRWLFGGFLKAPGTGFFEVENPLDALSPAGRAANACLTFFRYLGRTVLPLRLSADESAWSIRPLPLSAPVAVLSMLLLAGLTAIAIARFFRGSIPALGLLWMGLFLLPTSNLVFPIGTIFAERLAYLPSFGICLAAGAAIAGAIRTDRLGRSRALVLAAFALLLGARTVTRNAVWWTDRGLFTNLVATSPASAKAHYNLAWVSSFFEKWPVALSEYTRAVEIYDGYWDAWAGRGRSEKELGLYERAVKSYQKSIAILPGYENGYFGLGNVWEARGDFESAAGVYRRGLQDNPDSLPLAFRLAICQSRLRSPDAEEAWSRALRLGSQHGSVRAEHARWLLESGRTAAARREAREAWRRNPSLVDAMRVLAEADAREGMRLGEALALERVWRLTGKDEDRETYEAALARLR